MFVESPKGLWNERASNEPSRGSARAEPAPKGSARAQQSAMPVIGFLSVRELHEAPELTAAVRQGLKDTGFVEGQNIAIEYRFVGNPEERLPALAADLVHREVSVIVATTTPAAVAAKAVTTTIPIVFEMGNDPVQLRLVASLARPGGNVTGVTQLNTGLAPKRLEALQSRRRAS